MIPIVLMHHTNNNKFLLENQKLFWYERHARELKHSGHREVNTSRNENVSAANVRSLKNDITSFTSQVALDQNFVFIFKSLY